MNITISNIEELKSKSSGNSFWKINDSYTIFEKEIAEEFMGKIGKACDVEIETKGNYKNIRTFPIWLEKVEETATQTETKTQSVNPSKDRSIVAQCLTKCVGPQTNAKVLESYNYFLKNL